MAIFDKFQKSSIIDNAELRRIRKDGKKIVGADGDTRVVCYCDPDDDVLVVSHVLQGVEKTKS